VGLKVGIDWAVTVGGGGGGFDGTTQIGERESSETTTVGFTIADETVLDQFAVNVYTDPVYGTPMFILTGGWSM